MRLTRKILVSICFILFFCISAFSLNIKLGSLAPKGTFWSNALYRLQSDWLNLSNGKINLKIYTGGSVGDESDMLRKMRIGQLNAAAVTAPALANIFPGIFSIYIPQLVKNEEEYDYLISKMKPLLNQEFENKGYKILFWVQTGWIYLFSNNPVTEPEDLQPLRIWAGEGDKDTIEAWEQMGCNPIPVKMIDLVLQLQTNRIDALVSSPIYVLSYDLYQITGYMNGLKWAPFPGALVIDMRTWNRIDTDLQDRLQAKAQEIADSLQIESIEKEKEAISTMTNYGLVVNDISDETAARWKTLIDSGFLYIVENRYNIEYYEQAVRYVEEFRSLQN